MEPARGRFRHEALFYEGEDAFVADTSAFVREALDGGEAVLVAVVQERARALREELGADAAQVEFLDMGVVGRNPARIIPAWRDWAERNTARGIAFRGIGEPVWPGRSEIELRECHLHELLLDTAFSDGPGWWLLCPYDAGRLAQPVLEAAMAAHAPGREADSASGAAGGSDAFGTPPPELGPPLFEALFGLEDLPVLRTAIRERADLLGLHGRAVGDFVLVADELACNSIRHGGGRGRLTLWAQDGHAVCEVSDKGLIQDPLAGRHRPDLAGQGGGAGLWTCNQLCDLLLIHSTPGGGTGVRAYLPVR